jgi:hypothetical protein
MTRLTLRYKLFGRPQTVREFLENVCRGGRDSRRILISYEAHQSLVEPGANISPYMSYKIWLVLQASIAEVDLVELTDGKSQKKETTSKLSNRNTKKQGRTFRIELSTGTKTQFADADPLAQETLEAVQAKLPEIIDLCKKHGVRYHFDEKTTKLLMGNSK